MIPKFRVYHPDEDAIYYFLNFEEIVNWQYGDSYRIENQENCQVIYMQSTGLHDKNGVEIFEGDILKDKRGKIRFVYKVSGGFAINMFDSPRKIKDCFYESLADMQTQSWMQMSCEVIGNIYENKDLLEVQK